ncbi:hypothetical protein Tco_1442190 [Tanacetum coccineum]
METETRCLGKLEFHGEFDSEEEQDGMNVYRGLDVYVPPINDKEPETKGQNESDNQKEEKNKEDIDKGTEEGSSEGTEESRSEGTEESGTEGTEEDRSEGKDNGKEVQDDEKEEKMTGDNREVAVQMDVDNQNEEKVKKEKEKQDKVDKVKNVQEKQNADTVENVREIKDQDNHLTEDEFWNTQIDKLMTQAEIDIKNRKTPKRKSIVDMIPPTFSLGLSPEERELKSNKVEEKAAKGAKKSLRFLVSPYLNKKMLQMERQNQMK